MKTSWVILIAAMILISFALLFFILARMAVNARSHSISPYSGTPLRRTSEISYYSAEKILSIYIIFTNMTIGFLN